MFDNRSRYNNTKSFYFDSDETVYFKGVRPRKIGEATAVIEHHVKSWERLDQLALHYYNDARKWYRILDANPELMFGTDILGEENAGRIILIPRLLEIGK